MCDCLLEIDHSLDTDECTDNDGGCSHICVNEVGSYQCQCPNGYAMDTSGHNCQGWYIVQRVKLLFGGMSDCFNLHMLVCYSNLAVSLVVNKYSPCVYLAVFMFTMYLVLDINECSSNNGECSVTCVNTPGGYYCECPIGYNVDTSGFGCEGQ